ncbi:uncharacterized protein LOC128229224 isoform X2 [Mya arenaria]|nr:uncharacterized protein LOC128229224 isoform X2 [Mya arenaria]
MGEKGLAEAYILGIPFGLFGAHHFYLGRKRWGILYACTLGLLGLGYLYDLVRMRWLVKHANRHGAERRMVSDGYIVCFLTGLFGGHHFFLGNRNLGILYACTLGVFTVGWIVDLIRMRSLVEDHNEHREEKSLATAYVLGLSPLGIFGAYHYYLGNVQLGLIYTFTCGIFGIGWLMDLFRMPKLVRKAGLDKKSVGTAYIMAMPPFGLFGAHHYYLGNYGLGITYTLTLGIFSIGWIVDMFRMKALVKASNDPTSDYGTTKVTAYILCVSPLGIFGAHHFYLKRYLNGGFYVGTLGLFGIGWLFDMLRLPVLYERYADEDKHKYLDEAYVFWFPFGIFGMHHFYLGNKKWGILYACTFGCLLIGWIIDGIRMPLLLKKFNKYVEDPDMNNFRTCRPSCKCSVYNCKRCCMDLFECCSCFASFSLPRSESQKQERDVEVNGRTQNKDDFDVIREMYPDEDPECFAMNQNETNNQTEAQISSVRDSSDVYPDNQEVQTTPAYDNGAHPGDAGYQEEQLPISDGHGYHADAGENYNDYPVDQNYEQNHGTEYAYGENYGQNENYTGDETVDQNGYPSHDASYQDYQNDSDHNAANDQQYYGDQHHNQQQQQQQYNYGDNQQSGEVRNPDDVTVNVQTDNVAL